MKEIEFQFHRNNHLFAKVIRLFSRGSFNHVSIRIGRYVYEAHIDNGVTKTLYSKWKGIGVVESVLVEVEDTKTVEKWLNKQVGKKYDIFGVLSFLWIWARPAKGKWFCSELAMVTLAKALEIDIYNQRQTPQDFYYSLFLAL